MIPLLLLSALALAIIVERFWSLRRDKLLPPGLVEEVRPRVAAGKRLEAAHVDSLRSALPLGGLLAAELDVRNRGREVMREGVEATGRHLVHGMDPFLNTLGTIAGPGSLLG